MAAVAVAVVTVTVKPVQNAARFAVPTHGRSDLVRFHRVVVVIQLVLGVRVDDAATVVQLHDVKLCGLLAVRACSGRTRALRALRRHRAGRPRHARQPRACLVMAHGHHRPWPDLGHGAETHTWQLQTAAVVVRGQRRAAVHVLRLTILRVTVDTQLMHAGVPGLASPAGAAPGAARAVHLPHHLQPVVGLTGQVKHKEHRVTGLPKKVDGVKQRLPQRIRRRRQQRQRQLLPWRQTVQEPPDRQLGAPQLLQNDRHGGLVDAVRRVLTGQAVRRVQANGRPDGVLQAHGPHKRRQ